MGRFVGRGAREGVSGEVGRRIGGEWVGCSGGGWRGQGGVDGVRKSMGEEEFRDRWVDVGGGGGMWCR